MVWACFTSERLDPLIVYHEGGIGVDKYEDLIYDGLFSLIDDPLKPSDDPEIVHIADKNTFLFMQDNVSCHKADHVLEFLHKNHVSIMK